ncbi:hypothetical protein C8E83_1766 [Frondihabitans australicus]|uniref:DUF6993 domain-containing protein n=1 Tax=Frondihabitans australicus TaxID=386892 RepID=A0A495IF71_9MICO|nr:hypothetical protein C8E83_1766 [Frondihabitans australicus]
MALAIAGVVAAALTGCTQTSPTPAVSTSAAATPITTPTPTVPFGPTAPASVALAHFSTTVQTLLKTDPQPHGDDVITALEKAGFDKTAMEITPDATTIGRNVDSIEFAVLWQKKTCLIGQVGSAGYASTSAPVLSTGKCLVGSTRAVG